MPNLLARNIGGVMLLAYIVTQAKKYIISGPDAHFVSLFIWTTAGVILARLALKSRENYGNSLTYATAAALLCLSGSCYLWARAFGISNAIGVPHALMADFFAVAAMLLAGRGLLADVWVRYAKSDLSGAGSG